MLQMQRLGIRCQLEDNMRSLRHLLTHLFAKIFFQSKLQKSEIERERDKAPSHEFVLSVSVTSSSSSLTVIFPLKKFNFRLWFKSVLQLNNSHNRTNILFLAGSCLKFGVHCIKFRNVSKSQRLYLDNFLELKYSQNTIFFSIRLNYF